MPKLASITKNIDRFSRLRGFNKVDRKVSLKCNITMLKKAGQWQLYDDQLNVVFTANTVVTDVNVNLVMRKYDIYIRRVTFT